LISVPFWKMQAAGNDFVLVHGEDVAGADLREIARSVSRRNFSVGSDGLLVVSKNADGILLRMFNPDGSEDFCGNGARCAALHASKHGWVGGEFVIDHLGRQVAATVERKGSVTVTLPAASFEPADIPFRADATHEVGAEVVVQGVSGTPVSTGSTHFVVFRPYAMPDEEFFRLSPAIEVDPMFPERTSIMWTRIMSPGEISLRIWERGAGETLGCGTGSSAAACVYARQSGYEGPIAVQNPGGTINVAFGKDGPIAMTSIPVEVYSGTIELQVAARDLIASK